MIAAHRVLDADADHSVSLRTGGGQLDDLADDGDGFGLVHQPQQQEELIADSIPLGGGYEQTTILDKGHECRIEGVLFLDYVSSPARL